MLGQPYCNRSSGFAVGANDHLAVFFGRQALAVGFCGPLFHRRVQLNAFNRADLGKARAADDEAGFGALSILRFLPWHARNLSLFLPFDTPS